MSAPVGRRVASALARLWNLAWDVGLLASLALALLVVDLVAVHRGLWWVAAMTLLGFVGFEIGIRLGWRVMIALLDRRSRD